jgi:hypothetical protein
VKHLLSATIDGIPKSGDIERIAGGSIVTLQRACKGGKGQRTTHGMAVVGRGQTRMAGRTRLIADIVHFWSNVAKRGGEGPTRVGRSGVG